MGIFSNPNYSPTPPPGETFWGGMPQPHTEHLPPGAHIGHGHDGPNPRLPVADFLGNVANRGAGVEIPGTPTPRW